MFDLTTLQLLLPLLMGLAIGIVIGRIVISRRRARPTAVDELRANVQEQRESLRRAAATEYRPRGNGRG